MPTAAMTTTDAIATLARYAAAYPSCLGGIAERLHMDGAPAHRVQAYRDAERDVNAQLDAARAALGL